MKRRLTKRSEWRGMKHSSYAGSRIHVEWRQAKRERQEDAAVSKQDRRVVNVTKEERTSLETLRGSDGLIGGRTE